MLGDVSMSKCSENVRTICAAAAAIIVVCPARAEAMACRKFTDANFPDLSANPALALGHVTSAADRVHFVKEAAEQAGCPSRAPACSERAYLVPGDRVIISARRDAFICATYISAKRGARLGWLPADAVAMTRQSRLLWPTGSENGTTTTAPTKAPSE